jgi:hypothetical protein
MLNWDSSKIFTAITKLLKQGDKLLIKSVLPITCEISGKSIKYYHREEDSVTVGIETEPSSIIVNGSEISGWKYEKENAHIKIKLPAGEGILTIE